MAGRGKTLSIAAGFAAAIGVGRFVYTPLLPLIGADTGLAPAAGAAIAAANYLGYFAGAALTIAVPRTGDHRGLFRASLLAIVASEAAMALELGAASVPVWWLLRFAAGLASGIVFVHCSRAIGSSARLARGFAGVGAGIAASSCLVIAGRAAGLSSARLWLIAAGLTAILGLLALHPGLAERAADAPPRAAPRGPAPASAPSPAGSAALSPSPGAPAGRVRMWLLAASYGLEGMGYIIVATFLVAAVQASAGPAGGAGAGPGLSPALLLGNLVWVTVGACVIASTPVWERLRARFTLQRLLVAALTVQLGCALLPALAPGAVAGFAAAAALGATFMAIAQLSLARGRQLGARNSAAVLVTVYGLGQIAGPLVVAPLLGAGPAGYRWAFGIAAVTIAAAAALAWAEGRRR
ncbi:YbfB/YjiJ family MFS transporter [Brevibacterium sp. BRM-1]|uniref:YbfB/YjiJ family MFS transporter n=1 Tax=Brevibacterium sp. BRM-1 TaxID=2999062 RepID=UPI00227F4EF3|nr:YbfB/YjiJ family MFS transporter [Brevibacterium sp. BRM-1]WAL39835.1 YbfB/YjiJ family MFS transporter [Brevibacterium sp. BRM-1]